MTIVETTDNRLFLVSETANEGLAHVWWGVPLKAVKGGFAPKAKASAQLVRKAGCRLVEGRIVKEA